MATPAVGRPEATRLPPRRKTLGSVRPPPAWHRPCIRSGTQRRAGRLRSTARAFDAAASRQVPTPCGLASPRGDGRTTTRSRRDAHRRVERGQDDARAQAPRDARGLVAAARRRPVAVDAASTSDAQSRWPRRLRWRHHARRRVHADLRGVPRRCRRARRWWHRPNDRRGDARRDRRPTTLERLPSGSRRLLGRRPVRRRRSRLLGRRPGAIDRLVSLVSTR